MALSRSQIFIIGFVVVLAIGGWLGWQRVMQPFAVEREDRIAMSQVVTATFGKQSALKVGTLTGTVQATAADARLGGLLQSDSVMRAPYSVDYTVDLSGLSLKDYMWDPTTRTLIMRAPDVVVSQPNIDEAKMTVERRGVFITRDAFDAMSRIASRRAGAIAADKAKSPEMLGKARENARTALADLLRPALTAAGKGSVKVEVRFPADGTRSNERWDESRSLAEVFRDAR
jgi:Protein of unknown function (DUF4230)